MSSSDDDTRDAGAVPASRGGPTNRIARAAVSMAGFAVAMGCRFRSEAAGPMLPPLVVYAGVSCNYPGGPPECEPAACPIAQLSFERVGATIVNDTVSGVWEAGKNLAGHVFRKMKGESSE